ncbi:DUF2510 domain-containing protein [Microbacterium sp. SSW1-47]|uniref:DUF2510 domain-containing protein n=1 Tax=Microbacterium sufflavum TaxID=2851649 RepID=UPI001FFD6008|nr:DUF2510 domain-containing protein [Microbacterium sufflavum]MCK2027869.1 DUF2510 domain-containing protein [Microbacterium sufflavum]
MTTREGWYDDGSGSLRWWDGQQWTAHVRSIDPHPSAPEIPASSGVPQPPASTAGTEPAPAMPTPAVPTPAMPTPAVPLAATPVQAAFEPFVPPSSPFTPSSPYAAPPYAAAPGSAATAAPGNGAAIPLGPGSPGAPAAASSTTARRPSIPGLVGLAVALVGVVLACVPLTAPIGWVVVAAGFVVSLVSLFLRGTKWPGIAGLAVAVLGSTLAGAVALIAVGLTSVEASGDPVPSPSAPATESGSPVDPSTIDGAEMVAFEDLEVGDCLPYVDYTGEDTIFELPVVPCDQPHTDEVYFIYEVDDQTFPGESALLDEAWDGCLAQFEGFVGVPYEQSELDFYSYQPTKASWTRAGDRAIQCIAYSYDDVTGTLRGAAR